MMIAQRFRQFFSQLLTVQSFIAILLALNCFDKNSEAAEITYYNLVFSNPVQSTNGKDSDLGRYYSGLSYDFRNVSPSSGQSIDMRLTISVMNSSDYSYVGSFPNFNASANGLDGDLGVLYEYNGKHVVNGNSTYTSVGGINYTLTFYEGNGKYDNEITLPNVRLLLYDVDGESGQTERVRVYDNEGFYGYQLSNNSGIKHVFDASTGAHTFTGPGVNRDERDASGAFILHFTDVSKIHLTIEALTHLTRFNDSTINGVFTGIDGDLSLIKESEFNPIIPIPEPSGALLIFASGVFLLFRRRVR